VAAYGPKTFILTEDNVGTRYVFLTIRTFIDPNDEQDLKKGHGLQDAVKVEQAAVVKFEVPDCQKDKMEQLLTTINVVSSTVTDSSKMFVVDSWP